MIIDYIFAHFGVVVDVVDVVVIGGGVLSEQTQEQEVKE
jgi:hypothetical protein